MPYKDKDKQRAYQAAWMERRRREWLSGKSCARCNEARYEQLEVDHIDRDMKVSHRVWSWAKGKMLAELEKCQVLCRNCHVLKTNKELGQGVVQHGTHASYSNFGCRCPRCTEAHRVAARAYRAASKTPKPRAKPLAGEESLHVRRTRRRRSSLPKT